MKFFFLYSIIIFVLSSIIHFSTYILAKYSLILSCSYILNVFILLSFVTMIVNINKHQLKNENKVEIFDLFKYFPNKCLIMLMIFLIFIIYVSSNFMICSSLLQDGSPGILKGTFIQNNHGKIKVITELTYNKLSLIELRMFSGHWLIFSLLPILYFFYKKMLLKIEETHIA